MHISCSSLKKEEIHVWKVELGLLSQSHLLQIASYLTTEDHQKIKRFKSNKVKDNYIASRGLLKFLLSKYAGLSIRQIKIEENHFGKPFLSNNNHNNSINFNVSHSKDILIYAFTLNAELGVDVEAIESEIVDKGLEKYFMNRDELEEFDNLPTAQRIKLFFRIWTRKEAFLKAKGKGLFESPLKINVKEDSLTESNKNILNLPPYWILDLDIDTPGYAAALACKGCYKSILFKGFNSLMLGE